MVLSGVRLYLCWSRHYRRVPAGVTDDTFLIARRLGGTQGIKLAAPMALRASQIRSTSDCMGHTTSDIHTGKVDGLLSDDSQLDNHDLADQHLGCARDHRRPLSLRLDISGQPPNTKTHMMADD